MCEPPISVRSSTGERVPPTLSGMALVIGTHDSCDGVAVIDDTDGSLVDCAATEEEARAIIAADREANAGNGADAAAAGNDAGAADANLPERAVVIVAREGEQTADARYVEPGALTWREPPLTLTVNHDDSLIAGRLDAIARTESPTGLTIDNFDARTGDTGSYVVATVTFDLGLDADGNLVHPDAYGRVAARQVDNGFLTGVSMEVGDMEVSYDCVEWDPEEPDYCLDYLETLNAGRIGAVTVTPFQAIESARVVTTAAAPLDAIRRFPAPAPGAPVVAAIVDAPTQPPAAWFDDPGLTGPTALTVDDDGRVYGHLALWGVCHVGLPGCTTAPRSSTDYAHFMTGLIVCADGDRRAVGQLTIGTGHADLAMGAAAAAAHYDNTGTAWADVAAGEDDHGIWIAGAARPDLDDRTLREALAAPLSGDWRPIGRGLELVAALGVNTPGFPVTRARVASGSVEALVASYAPASRPCGCSGGSTSDADVRDRLAAVEAVIAALGLTEAAVEALAASVRPG